MLWCACGYYSLRRHAAFRRIPWNAPFELLIEIIDCRRVFFCQSSLKWIYFSVHDILCAVLITDDSQFEHALVIWKTNYCHFWLPVSFHSVCLYAHVCSNRACGVFDCHRLCGLLYDCDWLTIQVANSSLLIQASFIFICVCYVLVCYSRLQKLLHECMCWCALSATAFVDSPIKMTVYSSSNVLPQGS